jgi:hypothetical protein
MQIVTNNYTGERHFPIDVQCARCSSVIRLDAPADIEHRVHRRADCQGEPWPEQVFFVRCPACKNHDIIVSGLAETVKDMVIEHQRRRGPGAMDQR